jgi:hypothetical protein
MNTSTPSPNPFDFAIESLESSLAELATVARKLLARIQPDLAARKFQDTKRHATLARLETVLSDLLSSLS